MNCKRLVIVARASAGYQLAFRPRKSRGGYYLVCEPTLSEELVQKIKYSAAEVDSRQLEIFSKMSIAERFRMGFEISETALRAVAYRIQIENPGMNNL